MAVEERKLAVGNLAIGMYVCRLDRPWEGTPFPLQGVRIESAADIDALRRWASYVWIDIEKSSEANLRPLLLRLGYGVGRSRETPVPAPVRWETPTNLKEELPVARVAWGRAREVAARYVEDLYAGRPLVTGDLAAVVEPVVESVTRNADAYFWLEALRKRDPYGYSHAISTSALVTTFGRHLGFPREILVSLASGGMLMDLGLIAVPADLIRRGRSTMPSVSKCERMSSARSSTSKRPVCAILTCARWSLAIMSATTAPAIQMATSGS